MYGDDRPSRPDQWKVFIFWGLLLSLVLVLVMVGVVVGLFMGQRPVPEVLPQVSEISVVEKSE